MISFLLINEIIAPSQKYFHRRTNMRKREQNTPQQQHNRKSRGNKNKMLYLISFVIK